MKLNKQYILLIIILSISAGAFLLFPSFEREDFDTDIVEDISSGTISTTTTLNDESNSSIEEEIEVDTEVFETSIYDTLLINNETKRIDEKFISYLIIGSDERSLASSASRGTASGSRADVIMMVLIDQNSNPSLISIPRDLLVKDPCTKNIQRINASYEKNECGSSEENLSAVLLNITGLKVNHFVKFNFEGFEEIIDSFGGVENLSLKKVNDKNKIPIENYQLYCDECKFRSVSGFIKIEFDKREGIIPRSTFKFFTSPDGDNWDQVGFTRTKGEIITFVPNNSYIELGGHSDGQSFGNTFLDANVLSIEISTLEKTKKIIFEKQKQNEDFFVFKPNTQEDYKANITYENNGIKLFRPNKYWVAINNEFDFTNDFQIILNLTLPEIPWETHTLISNSSIFNDQIQSWKVDIDDGRIFFNWNN